MYSATCIDGGKLSTTGETNDDRMERTNKEPGRSVLKDGTKAYQAYEQFPDVFLLRGRQGHAA